MEPTLDVLEARTKTREDRKDEIEGVFEELDGKVQTIYDAYRSRLEAMRTREKNAVRARHAIIAKQSSLNEQSLLVQSRFLTRLQTNEADEANPNTTNPNSSIKLLKRWKDLKIADEIGNSQMTPLTHGLLSSKQTSNTIELFLHENDEGNQQERLKFTTFGQVGRTIESIVDVTEAHGTDGNDPGQFRCPLGIAVHPQTMNIYVVEWDNYRVQVFNPQFQFVRSMGSLGKGNTQFDYPRGVTVSPEGRVAITDHNNNRVQVYDSELNYLFSIGKGNPKHSDSSFGALQSPYSAIYDTNGYLYVADKGGRQIQKYDHDGEYIQSIGKDGEVTVDDVESIAVLSNGNICSASCSCLHIVTFTPDGQFVSSFEVERLSSHVSICNGYDDSIFVSDFERHIISIYDKNGQFVKKLGGSGSSEGMFKNPRGLTFGPDNRLYVCDYRNNRVQIF